MTPAEILQAMQGKTALVVGDWIKDRYHFGRVERVCPEAPVPVFIKEHGEDRPGGAANVAHQLAALGVKVLGGLSSTSSWKERWMVGQHMLLRADKDVECLPDPDDIRRIRSLAGEADVVVLSDYAKGWLTSEMCRQVLVVASEYGVPVVVDPKGAAGWDKYYGCSLICPNEKEHPGGSRQDFDILHKQGAKGMTLYQRQSDYGRVPAVEAHIPATARHIYDVTGAGDTVVAVVAAGLAAGASKLEAATLAALAAGYVVGEVGTAVCPLEKLKELVNAR